jgi:hypothetical protein
MQAAYASVRDATLTSVLTRTFIDVLSLTAVSAPGAFVSVHFECEGCGSVAVKLPRDLVEDARVACSRCNETLCTWGEFKERTREILIQDNKRGKLITSDPLHL